MKGKTKNIKRLKESRNNNIKLLQKNFRSPKAITLVALVVTIVILIILSTVTINVLLGEGGLINQAKLAKELASNSMVSEEESMNTLMAEYTNIMAAEPEIPVPEEPYVDSVLPEAPKVGEGMTPVKWDGANWVKTDETDSEWYDYSQKKWANIVLGDATFTTSGEKEVLDESKAYSMLVWIPRYAYQITTNYHTNSTSGGNINIVFIDTANKNKAGDTTYNESYPSVSGSSMSSYVVHPAFNYGGTKLSGFWVGKYETSHTGCTTTSSTGSSNTNVTTLTPMIKAGVTSWRSIQVSNIYTVCTEMNKSGNVYGLNTSDSVVDPHMMKNSEWGAVAYLSQNATYGKGSEVWINPNSNYITGQAGSSVSASGNTSTSDYKSGNGLQASTTGNVWGVYDMSGGAYEYVAAYVNNSYADDYASTLVGAAEKYRDVYRAVSSGTSGEQQTNYNYSQPTTGLGQPTATSGHYGDAVWETSSSYSSTNSWYSDSSSTPYSSGPFFIRGGYYGDTSEAGVFGFVRGTGTNGSNSGFRVVLALVS